jgi:hypothetical protein
MRSFAHLLIVAAVSAAQGASLVAEEFYTQPAPPSIPHQFIPIDQGASMWRFQHSPPSGAVLESAEFHVQIESALGSDGEERFVRVPGAAWLRLQMSIPKAQMPDGVYLKGICIMFLLSICFYIHFV